MSVRIVEYDENVITHELNRLTLIESMNYDKDDDLTEKTKIINEQRTGERKME